MGLVCKYSIHIEHQQSVVTSQGVAGPLHLLDIDSVNLAVSLLEGDEACTCSQRPTPPFLIIYKTHHKHCML